MKVFRGRILHVVNRELHYIQDGVIKIDSAGKIEKIGSFDKKDSFSNLDIIHFHDEFLVPGFVDTHLHFPQTDIIGCYEGELLEWLNTYTFPEEATFNGGDKAQSVGKFFCNELLANGTTTSMVFSSSDYMTTHRLFDTFKEFGARGVLGKVGMDRNAPDNILVPVEQDLEECHALLKNWHGVDQRLFMALTPRFAPTCSEKMLEEYGLLLSERNDLFFQTHHSENLSEIEWVRELFPSSKNYLDVYDRFGLLGPRSVFAHAIHSSSEEISKYSETGSSVAHCPTSNLFLGSGLFPFSCFKKYGISVGLGSDIGGGISFSIWKTMAEAIKVSKLIQEPISPTDVFYAATLGGAACLDMDKTIGNFEVGKELDFQVINPKAIRLLSRRLDRDLVPEEMLAAMIFHGDDRMVQQVFVRGKQVYKFREM